MYIVYLYLGYLDHIKYVAYRKNEAKMVIIKLQRVIILNFITKTKRNLRTICKVLFTL